MNYCILLHIDRESHFVILSFLHILVLIFVILGFFSFLFFFVCSIFFLLDLFLVFDSPSPFSRSFRSGFYQFHFALLLNFFQSFLLRFSFSSLRSVLTFHSSLPPDFFSIHLFIHLFISHSSFVLSLLVLTWFVRSFPPVSQWSRTRVSLVLKIPFESINKLKIYSVFSFSSTSNHGLRLWIHNIPDF